MSIAEALEAALKHHQAGRLAEAERLCRQVLATDPSQMDAWHVLGLVMHQAGQGPSALQYLREAVRLKPDFAGTHFSLGNVLRDLGHFAEAIASYQRCLQLQPDLVEAHYNLGNAFNDQKQPARAVESFQQAVRLRPNYVKALNNLGNTLLDLERPAEAATAFEQTLKFNPNYAAGHSNLGSALRQLGRLEEAIVHCQKSLELAPGNFQSLNNLGAALMDLRRHADAATAFEKALQINPAYVKGRCNLAAAFRELGKLDEAIQQAQQVLQREPGNSEALNTLGAATMDKGGHAEAATIFQQMLKLNENSFAAHHGLGTAMWQMGQLEDAVSHCEKAVALSPESTEALDSLAVALLYQGRVRLALDAFDRALATKPDYPDAHTNRAIAYLIAGDFDRGWAEYEWRWRTKAFPARESSRPLWDGGDLTGSTILVYSEQGIGDSLHFVRYLSCLRRRGARVVFECPKSVHRLMEGRCGIDELVASGAPSPPHDVCAPLLSLPHLLKLPDPKDAPKVPYLFADPNLIDFWKAELANLDGFKIGINWQGNPKHSKDSFRSIPLAQFLPLAKVPGVRLVSLQKGFGKEQLQELPDRDLVLDLGSRLDETAGAFMDTAAVLHSLDLVITTDTALAHLAGSLGRPVWVALPASPDWRWLLTGETTAWYPSMRLFRQSKLKDWESVVAQMASEIKRQMGGSPNAMSLGATAERASSQQIQTTAEMLTAGSAHFQAHEYAEAEQLCRKILAEDLTEAAAWHMLGLVMEQTGRSELALQYLQEAARLKPDFAEAHHNLGIVLHSNGRFNQAIEASKRSLQLVPHNAEANVNIGSALRDLGRLEEATQSYHEALKINPNEPNAINNLGTVLLDLGKPAEALPYLNSVLSTVPDFAPAHRNMAIIHLLAGNYRAGWEEYEWRWQTKPFVPQKFRQPRWDGSDLSGKTILIYTEQGFGDSLQFARYLPVLQERGARVLFGCPPKLESLLKSLAGINEVIAEGRPLPPFDVHAPLMSLPHLLNLPDPGESPRPPYLFANPQRIAHWKAELAQLDGFKVGITWQGNPANKKDRFRSIPLAQFLPMADVPGVRLISLQKGFGQEQLQELPKPDLILDLGSQLDETGGAFLDTAAVLHSLDLVITSDTAVAHLAGAMGLPVWLALSAAPDWRWLEKGQTTPWYPTMRLFRQTKLNDWTAVFAQIATELQEHVSRSRTKAPLGTAKEPATSSPTQSNREMLETATSLYKSQKYAEAEQLCRQVLAKDSKDADAWHVLGLIMEQTDQTELALQYLQDAVRQKPDFAEAHNNLGILYQKCGRSAEALEASKRSLQLAPGKAEAYGNIGDALRDLGRTDEALLAYQEALRIDPKHPVALNNLGMLFLSLGRYDEAGEYFKAALAANPNYATAHRNMAMIRLRSGDYRAGWAEYEWRWQTKALVPPKLPQPPWDGGDLMGKTILIYAEQGLGDTLQFVRYLPLLRERGARVIFNCPAKLELLLNKLNGLDVLIVERQRLPPFDVHAPLLSLPHLLNLPDPAASPRPPYVFADPVLVERWRCELGKLDGLKVGINWQGSPTNKMDHVRSIPLAQFLPLAEVPGVRLISLQKGFGQEQREGLANPDLVVDLGSRLDETGGPFLDTAAALHSLDLVITSDTAVAHLAGAMGRPVWLALSAAPDWRWLLTGEATAWYPSMRLFRQRALGDWASVFTAIASELTSLVDVKR